MIRTPSYMYVYVANIRSYESVDISTYMVNYRYIYCLEGSLMIRCQATNHHHASLLKLSTQHVSVSGRGRLPTMLLSAWRVTSGRNSGFYHVTRDFGSSRRRRSGGSCTGLPRLEFGSGALRHRIRIQRAPDPALGAPDSDPTCSSVFWFSRSGKDRRAFPGKL
jgi:hypothetical protein